MMHTTVVTVSTKIVQEGMFRGPLGYFIQPICLLTGCTAAAHSTQHLLFSKNCFPHTFDDRSFTRFTSALICGS